MTQNNANNPRCNEHISMICFLFPSPIEKLYPTLNKITALTGWDTNPVVSKIILPIPASFNTFIIPLRFNARPNTLMIRNGERATFFTIEVILRFSPAFVDRIAITGIATTD